MMRWGKTMLSGLLSVTTAALLTPATTARARAWSARGNEWRASHKVDALSIPGPGEPDAGERGESHVGGLDDSLGSGADGWTHPSSFDGGWTHDDAGDDNPSSAIYGDGSYSGDGRGEGSYGSDAEGSDGKPGDGLGDESHDENSEGDVWDDEGDGDTANGGENHADEDGESENHDGEADGGVGDDENQLSWEVRLGDAELVSNERFASGELVVVLRSAAELADGGLLDADGCAQPLDFVVRDDGAYEAQATLPDGLYGQICVRVTSVTGKTDELAFENVKIDAVAPRYRATWDCEDEGVVHDGVLHERDARTLTVVVEDVDAADELSLTLNGKSIEALAEGGVLTYEVPCESDGDYELILEGTDAFGREPTWSGDGLELPLSVVVDTCEPTARVLYDGTELDDADLFGGALHVQARPSVVVEVCDAHLDPESLRIGGVSYGGWEREGDVWRLELPHYVPFDAPLAISGCDWAGNTVATGSLVVPVVVDATAPTVEAEHVTPDVVAVDADLVSLFFAHDASVRLFVRDDKGLASIEVNPSDVCEVSQGGFTAGDTQATLTLALREGGEFTSEVEVRATDLAGNWRTWSIAEEGIVCDAGEEHTGANAAVYLDAEESPVYPLVLLLDTVAPVVEVRGAEEGCVYATPRDMVVSIDETSFAHVLRHQGVAYADQVVASWMLSNPKAGEAEKRMEALRARDFKRNDVTGRWEATLNVAQDGDYTLLAHMTDVVGNASADVVQHFSIDATAPECEVTFVQDEGHPEEHEGMYYRSPRMAVVRVREHNWESMKSLEVRYVTEDERMHAIAPSLFEEEGDDWYRCEVPFEHDGSYQLLVDAVDGANNRMKPYVSQPFAIDTTNPVIRVSYAPVASRRGRYHAEPRKATITIVEHNWGDDERYFVKVDARDVADGYVPHVSRWHVPNENKPDEHVCTVDFARDGAYELRVWGRDLAGRDAMCGSAVGYDDSFVVDLEAPAVEVGFAPSSYTTFENTKYVRVPLDVPVSVRDRNLDAEATTLSWDGAALQGDERIGWTCERPDSTGEVRRSRVVQFSHGEHISPSVDALDKAGNRTRVEGERFVVDLEAPRIVGVSTSTRPVATYEGELACEHGEVQFFNQPTEIVFEVADEFGIDGVSLYDPDGEYSIGDAVERGCAQARVSVRLAQQGNTHAADAFERNIVFEVADIAGNRRSWTLNRRGEVVAERVDEGEQALLNGSGEPAGLVYDGIAPQVSVEGVTEGSISKSTQMARVSVSERNFAYLRAFRPSEVVVRVTSHDATPQRSEHVEEVRVGAFEGDDPQWTYEHAFATDGHYAITASFADVANHPSNRVDVGEFTIDKTPPRITVTWDHDLAEANYANGQYYFRTTREATVVVHEHNFRAGDYKVDAGAVGAVGAWHDAGNDNHVCTVSYVGEAKDCELKVSGKDEAGNEAAPYEQRGFVIDLTPPVVEVLNVVGPNGERAFSGAVSPALVFDDGPSGNFDASEAGWSYELRGMRDANSASRGNTGRFGQREEVASGGATVTFEDFGASAEAAGGFEVTSDDVYVLTAKVRDLAGNEGVPANVTFSLNRFGSNFFVEDMAGLVRQGGETSDADAVLPLATAPTIVVHEINVSGARSEADHSVIRDYANAPEELVQDERGARPKATDAGYSLQALSDPSDFNAYGGWAEYVYTIRSGNFGEGAIGEGDGQGLYRINVGSVDAANNANTTSRYWASDAGRNDAADKSATVAFTLDELGPIIDDLDVRQGITVGAERSVTFHVTDDISCGDEVEVLVDGEPVEVRSVGSGAPVNEAGISTGTYSFVLPSRAFAPHSICVRVADYNGRVARRSGTLYVSTFVVESTLVALFVGMGVAGHAMWRRRKDAEEPAYPSVV